MKKYPAHLAVLLFVLFATAAAQAQSSVDARDIIRQIDDKRRVNISNATIRGDLDFTELANQQRVRNSRRGNEEYKSTVEVPLVFTNCTFRGDVIAYKTLDSEGRNRGPLGGDDQALYTADFGEEVIFENCKFEGKTEFKYSDFDELAVFVGNDFRREANFKYANFQEDARFEGCDFGNDANFKYAEFRGAALFRDARIYDTANFKYADFDREADFSKARFSGSADFKYAEFRRNGDFTDADFRSRPDFKYTKGRRSM